MRKTRLGFNWGRRQIPTHVFDPLRNACHGGMEAPLRTSRLQELTQGSWAPGQRDRHLAGGPGKAASQLCAICPLPAGHGEDPPQCPKAATSCATVTPGRVPTVDSDFLQTEGHGPWPSEARADQGGAARLPPADALENNPRVAGRDALAYQCRCRTTTPRSLREGKPHRPCLRRDEKLHFPGCSTRQGVVIQSRGRLLGRCDRAPDMASLAWSLCRLLGNGGKSGALLGGR